MKTPLSTKIIKDLFGYSTAIQQKTTLNLSSAVTFLYFFELISINNYEINEVIIGQNFKDFMSFNYTLSVIFCSFTIVLPSCIFLFLIVIIRKFSKIWYC